MAREKNWLPSKMGNSFVFKDSSARFLPKTIQFVLKHNSKISRALKKLLLLRKIARYIFFQCFRVIFWFVIFLQFANFMVNYEIQKLHFSSLIKKSSKVAILHFCQGKMHAKTFFFLCRKLLFQSLWLWISRANCHLPWITIFALYTLECRKLQCTV